MDQELDIFYATGTGNAKRLVKKLSGSLRDRGFSACVESLRDHTIERLHSSSFALFFISTWGEGDPPPDSETFFQTLLSSDRTLEHLTYCTVGLGDSCFVNFCGASVTLDTNLQRLGAKPAMPLRKLDVCFMPEFRKWQDNFFEQLDQSFNFANSAQAANA